MNSSIKVNLSKTKIMIFGPNKRNLYQEAFLPRQRPNWDNPWMQIPWDWFYAHGYFETFSKRRRIVGMKALMGTSRREPLVEPHVGNPKSHLFKALVLPTSTYGTEIWRGDLKNRHWKVFEKGMKMHMMSHVKVCCLITYHTLLAKFGKLPIELYALKLTTGASNNGLPTYPPLG